METSSTNLTPSQASLLQNQYGRSSLLEPSFNAIPNSVLDVDPSLNESAIEFIHLSFKKIQHARVEALLIEKPGVTVTLKNVQTNGFGPAVKRFYETHCQISLEWIPPFKGCYKINIYSSVDADCFSRKSFSEMGISKNGHELPSLNLFQDRSCSMEYYSHYFTKIEKFNEKFAFHAISIINDIFKNLILKRDESKVLNKQTFCVSTIIKDTFMVIRSNDRLVLDTTITLVDSISLFFRSYMGMIVAEEMLDGNYTDYTLTTDINNPCFKPINPKPELPPIFKTMCYSEFQLNDCKFTDVSFIFSDGREIKAHKIILSFSLVLEKMFNVEFKNENSKIPFYLCDYKSFLKFKQFIYTGNLSVDYLKDFQNCLEMISLANKLEYDPLSLYAKRALENKIDKENFIEIASLGAILNDDYLLKLCRWFAMDNIEFGDDLEFSNFHIDELAVLLQSAIKNYNLPNLKKALINSFNNALTLDMSFINICSRIYKTKDSEFKIIFQDALLGNPELLKKLRDNKDIEEYKGMWIAFQELFTAIEI